MDINKLKDMDIKDLKDIDLTEVKDYLLNKLDLTICIGISLITIILSISFITGNRAQVNNLKNTLTTKNELLNMVQTHKTLQEATTNFTEDFPEFISSDDMINEISQLASLHDVQIESLSPVSGEKNDYYQTESVEFKIISKDYNNIILFTKDIESLKYSIRIDKWSASLHKGDGRRGRSRRNLVSADKQEEQKISVAVTLSSVQLL